MSDEIKSGSFKVSPQALAREMMKEMSGIESPRPDQCARCGGTVVVATEFVDEASRREWAITQMCQACQDFVFQEWPEDDDGEEA